MHRRHPAPVPRKSAQGSIAQTLEDSTTRTDQLLRESRQLMAATDALLDATSSFAQPAAPGPAPESRSPPADRAQPVRKPGSTPNDRR